MADETQVIVRVPPKRLLLWLLLLPMERIFISGTALPAVARTEMPTGDWGAPGTRRVAFLEDRSTAVVEVVDYQAARKLSLVLWNFTSAAGLAVEAIFVEFEVAAQPSGTMLRVTTRFRPTSHLFAGALKSFAAGDYHLLLDWRLRDLVREAEADYEKYR